MLQDVSLSTLVAKSHALCGVDRRCDLMTIAEPRTLVSSKQSQTGCCTISMTYHYTNLAVTVSRLEPAGPELRPSAQVIQPGIKEQLHS
jgi:hypothetical protein